MRVRTHVRCQCTHFQADPCRDGRERDDLVIRCRCGPGGCVSGRRAKSTRASSNPVSEYASDHALTSWSALRRHLCQPLLGLACAPQRTSLARLGGHLCRFCSPAREAATVRRSGSSRATPSSRSARHAAYATSARGWSDVAAHEPPIASADVAVCGAACLCLLSHRSDTFLQRQQLEDPRQRLRCSCLLAPRALLPRAASRLACSPSRCAPLHRLAPVPLLELNDTSPTLPSALVDPLRLELGQQPQAAATTLAHTLAPRVRPLPLLQSSDSASPALAFSTSPDGPVPSCAPAPRSSSLLVGLTRPAPSAVVRLSRASGSSAAASGARRLAPQAPW
jgi:hypothetical protein